MKRLLILLILLSRLAESHAQQIKIASIDIEYIYANLPAHKKLMAEMDSASTKYQALQKDKLTLYQQKLQAYQQLGKQTPEPVIKDKTTELETLQASMQEFQNNAEKDLRAKYAARFPAIEQQVKAAIVECAREQKVSYITRTYADYPAGESTPFLLYASDPQSDLTDVVLSKLGVANHPEKGKSRKRGIVK